MAVFGRSDNSSTCIKPSLRQSLCQRYVAAAAGCFSAVITAVFNWKSIFVSRQDNGFEQNLLYRIRVCALLARAVLKNPCRERRQNRLNSFTKQRRYQTNCWEMGSSWPVFFSMSVDGRVRLHSASQSAGQCDGNTMSRYTTMTIGFLLVFMGIKFHMVESYLLTPDATKFWNERVGDQGNAAPNFVNNQVADGFNGNNGYSAFNGNSYNSYNSYGNNNGFANTGGYGAANNSVFQSASYQSPNAYQQPPVNNQGSLLGSLAYGPQKQLTTPKWLGWPILFLGAVFILQGAAMRRNNTA